MKTNWQIKKLGEIVQIQNGFAFKSSDYVDSGFFVMRITNVQDGIIELNNPKYISQSIRSFGNFILKENDILMSLTGNVGRVGIIKKNHLPAVLNQRVARLNVSDQVQLDRDFLFYFLRSPKFFDEVVRGGKGMAQQNVSTKDIENLEIPLPPLETQKEIVARLDEKFAKLREAKRLREEALSDTEKILPQTLREIFEEGKQKGWEEKTFEEVLVFKTGKLDSNAMVPSGKYPFFTCAQKTYAIDSYSFDQKAVLLAGNNAAGKYSVKFYDGKFDAYQRTYVISVKNQNQLDYIFLKNYISHILNDLRDLSVGANTKFLTMRVLNKIMIPLPSLAEQKQIVKKLDTLSEKLRTLREPQISQFADLKSLERAYLREAFRGELV